MPGLFSVNSNPALQGWRGKDNNDGTLTPSVLLQPAVAAWPTLTAAGTTVGVNLGMAAHKHTLQVIVTGGPATGQIQLEGTLDDATSSTANWFSLSGSQLCTSSTIFHVADRPVTGVRANLTALTGGTNPAIALKYTGVQ